MRVHLCVMCDVCACRARNVMTLHPTHSRRVIRSFVTLPHDNLTLASLHPPASNEQINDGHHAKKHAPRTKMLRGDVDVWKSKTVFTFC